MGEIKIGEYIRTKNGYIIKYKDNLNTNIFTYDDNLYVENSLFPDEEEIVKHSPNIINLIEVGDYVNGHLVVDKHIDIDDNGNDFITIEVESDLMIHKSLVEKHIKSIVTKEQFKSMEYRLED